MARLIHLNGLPGVGKSTLARRYACDHPGTLVCDVDVLRTMIGGWQRDKDAAGRIRTTALALITAYLRTGYDVVLPQLVGRSEQLDRFRTAAAEATAEYVHLLLVADWNVLLPRFRGRAQGRGDEWSEYATQFWAAAGGDVALRDVAARLDEIDSAAVRVPSTQPDATYAALLVALDRRG